MKNGKRRSSFFLRFSLSYIAVLLLPTIILFTIMIRSTAENCKESLMDYEAFQARMLEASISSELQNCAQIVRSLCFYQEVEPFELQSTPGKAGDLIKNINKHHNNFTVVDEIFVYFFVMSIFIPH